MAVTTRAMGRRSQNVNPRPTQRAAAQPTTGPTRGQVGRRQRAQRAPSPPAEDDNETDSDEDDDDSSDEDDAPDDQGAARRRALIITTFAAFDPGLSSPRELVNGIRLSLQSQHTVALATAVADLVRTPADLGSLQRSVPVGGHFWSMQLLEAMRQRYHVADRQLQLNVERPGYGHDIPSTIASLQQIYSAVDSIRSDHFAAMQEEDQRSFVALLVNILMNLLFDDRDQYANAPRRPHYAGEGIQSERRLFASFISARGQPVSFLEVLGRMSGALLRHEAQTLIGLLDTAERRLALLSDMDVDRERLVNVVLSLQRLIQDARASP